MIHKFKAKDLNIVLDVNSGGVHLVDDMTYDLLDYIEEPLEETCPQKALDELSGKYTVEQLSSDVGMTRMNLYRKLQNITGQTPTEFIRSIRLKRAAQLLQGSQLTILQISDLVGYNSSRAFSKNFKEMFGMLPSQYAELHNGQKKEQKEKYRCYRKTALLLFLLNIPIGGMIVLMVRTNSGFTYPGYIIYLSALYTFYTLILSIINLVKFHELGDLILSAAKVLNFISAMMSVLGLQTAMISRFFENGESYRKLMNTLTGSSVYLIVIVTAVYMLIHSRKYGRQVEKHE